MAYFDGEIHVGKICVKNKIRICTLLSSSQQTPSYKFIKPFTKRFRQKSTFLKKTLVQESDFMLKKQVTKNEKVNFSIEKADLSSFLPIPGADSGYVESVGSTNVFFA